MRLSSRAGLVWAIKVRFVKVCTRNGPCVGTGRGLNGGVVQSGVSGRPPSDPHPRSEPLLDASHSERTPLLAVRNVPQPLLSIAAAAISLAASCIALKPPRHSLLQLHSHASRIPSSLHVVPAYSIASICSSPSPVCIYKTVARVFLLSSPRRRPGCSCLNSELSLLRRPLFLSSYPSLLVPIVVHCPL